MANTLNQDIYRGKTKTMRMTFEGGAAVGDRVRMMVRESLDGEALITKEEVLDSSMTIVITIENKDTQQLEPGTYIYDIDLDRGEINVPLIERSKMRIRGDVTHD